MDTFNLLIAYSDTRRFTQMNGSFINNTNILLAHSWAKAHNMGHTGRTGDCKFLFSFNTDQINVDLLRRIWLFRKLVYMPSTYRHSAFLDKFTIETIFHFSFI